MSPLPPKLFVTGDPGCGKTTLVRRVVERLRGRVPMTGFLTEEVREAGRRVGFRGVTLDGKEFLLAHVREEGVARVGPYGVVLEGLDTLGLASLRPGPETRLVVLDEVGKMESFSPAFRETVEALLASPVAILGTVAVHGVGFPKRVRQDPRIERIKMTRASRDGMVGEILRRLKDAGIG